MIFEIRGISFKGHGAELMMRAIIDHVRIRMPEAQFAVEPVGSFAERAEYGFLSKTPRVQFRRSTLATAFMSPAFRQTYGIVEDRDIDVVLDASGFAYSDQWGAVGSQILSSRAKSWKADRPDKRIILLPQAFGPFEMAECRRAFQQAMSCVDLAFARDADSFSYLQSCANGTTEIGQAPDFTCMVAGEPPLDFAADRAFACIAPNVRMLDKTSVADKEAYLGFLVKCVHEVVRQELEPVFLTHWRSDDETIVEMVNQALGWRVTHVHHRDVRQAKGMIGNSRLLIGSRFHVLVSALSQAVPSIGTGWSHKYNHLFGDYQCSEYLCSPTDPFEKVVLLIEQTLADDSRQTLVARLEDSASKQQEATRQMWHRVDSLLEFPR